MTPDDQSAVRFLAALAEGTCLRIIEHLAAGPANVTAIAAALGLKLVNVSGHLNRLRLAGVLDSERDGRFIAYRLVGAELAGGNLVLRRPGVAFVMALATPARTKQKKK